MPPPQIRLPPDGLAGLGGLQNRRALLWLQLPSDGRLTKSGAPVALNLLTELGTRNLDYVITANAFLL